MHRTRLVVTAALSALVGIPSAARAQQAADSARRADVPTCEEAGVRRAAVMVPPGQTTEQLRANVAGGLFPVGTEVLLLQPGQLMPLRAVPLAFSSDWSLSRRQTEVRTGPPSP
jgi:hypothetical protein